MRIIKDYPNYKINKIGQIINCKGLILKPKIMQHGYLSITLCNSGICKGFLIHRLMAQQYLNLDIQDKNIQVDHINNDKSDNKLENLRLVTASENQKARNGTLGKDTINQKYCQICLQLKPKYKFDINKATIDKLYYMCKSCRSIKRKSK